MKSLQENALEDIYFIHGKWGNDRKWFFENYPDLMDKPEFWCRNCSFWKLFDANQLAEIYTHYKNEKCFVRNSIHSFIRRYPKIKSAFKKAVNGTVQTRYSMLRKNDIILILKDKTFSLLKDISNTRNLLKHAGAWDVDIEAILEDKSTCFRNGKIRPNANGAPLKAAHNFAKRTPKESLILDKSKNEILSSNRKITEKWGIDGSIEHRRIIKKALFNRIKPVDFCTTPDDVFVDLLKFFELQNYEECLEILPALANYLASRCGGTKKDLFFPNRPEVFEDPCLSLKREA